VIAHNTTLIAPEKKLFAKPGFEQSVSVAFLMSLRAQASTKYWRQKVMPQSRASSFATVGASVALVRHAVYYITLKKMHRGSLIWNPVIIVSFQALAEPVHLSSYSC